MENQVVNLTMDGKTIGIGIYSWVEDKQLTNKQGDILIFRNISQAKMYVENAKGYTNHFDYDFNIIINDSIIDYSEFDFVNGAYQLYGKNENTNGNFIYNVYPVEKFAVTRLGYIVFNDNARIIGDNEAGKKICKQNFDDLKEAVNTVVKYPNKKNALQSVKRTYDTLNIKVKRTSGSINVLYNSQIMNINQNRKNLQLRSFQFNKEMDKYNTLYFFIQKEFYEPDFFGTTQTCVEAFDDIIKELQKKRPDVRLEYLDIRVPIEIGNDLVEKYSRREKKYDQSNKS